jgi:hypothetical protein
MCVKFVKRYILKPRQPQHIKEGTMACTVRRETVELKIDVKNQTREKVHEMLDQLLRENGAIECGLMGGMTVTFEKPAAR